eukprot:gene2693-5303_t
MEEVHHTSHISFDKVFKTFRIYSGDSLYAFAISPELSLEHLYWGKKLPKGYDLRYLSQSSRLTHFNTTEIWRRDLESSDGISRALHAETLDEIQDTWRLCRGAGSRPGSPQEGSSSRDRDDTSLQQKRLENACWRMMGMKMGSSDELSSPAMQNNCNGLSIDDDYASMDTVDISYSAGTSLPPKSPMGLRSRTGSGAPLPEIPEGYFTPTNGGRSSLSLATGSSNDMLVPAARIPNNSTATTTTRTGSGPSPSHSKKQESKPAGYRLYERKTGEIGKGELCVEYSDHGTGDFRSPSFTVSSANGSSISPLRYRRHKIYKGKLPLPYPLPAIRSSSVYDSSTLVVTLADIHTGLEVDLIYVALHGYDAITRRAVFRNVSQNNTPGGMDYSSSTTSSTGATTTTIATMKTTNSSPLSDSTAKEILRANSMTVDFESTSTAFHVVQLSGSWARERQVVETKLTHGMLSFSSLRGVSSHQHNPFAALTTGPPNETFGETKGFALVYSGNFLIEAELSEMGSEFCTPEAVLVRSSEGLGGMSRVFHRLFSDRLLPSTWADHAPPIILNSWEAKYFAVDHDNIIEMARQ